MIVVDWVWSVAEMGTGVRTVDALVAASGPASAAWQEASMIAATDLQDPTGGLGLDVALQTESRVALSKHLLIGRTVRTVTGCAALAGCLVLEDPRTGLLGVALNTGLVHAGELRAAALGSGSTMRIVAICAAHLAAKHGVSIGKIEGGLHIKVTVHAALGVLAHVDDRAGTTARFDVLASGPVASFTAEHRSILTLDQKFGMGRSLEAAGNVLVTLGALLGANKLRPGNPRRSDNRIA
jgi:hypothetical protein